MTAENHVFSSDREFCISAGAVAGMLLTLLGVTLCVAAS